MRLEQRCVDFGGRSRRGLLDWDSTRFGWARIVYTSSWYVMVLGVGWSRFGTESVVVSQSSGDLGVFVFGERSVAVHFFVFVFVFVFAIVIAT